MGSDWGKIDEAEQPGLNPNIGILLAVISVGREGENKKEAGNGTLQNLLISFKLE